MRMNEYVFMQLEPHPVGNNNPANRPALSPEEKFDWRVTQMMQKSGRERGWCLQHCREKHPQEYRAYSEARGAGWRGGPRG